MGRPSKSKTLNIWMNGELVGVWIEPSRGEAEFRYEKSWFNSGSFRSLSLSLPANPIGPVVKGERVTAFFDNLLPDSDSIRRRLQQKFSVPGSNAIDLLTAIGRDCAGAIQLLPEHESPHCITKIDADPLTEHDIERVLSNTVAAPGVLGHFDEDDFRISIAGAQEKTALLWHEERWCRPLGATPTTHIFKLPIGLVGNRMADMRTSVENEWLCSRILNAYGIATAQSEIYHFGDQKCLVVKRFDRRLHSSGQYWLRLPQEDFCQATGTPVFIKYEADGGPGMQSISGILSQSENRNQDLKTFLKTQILFWMLRATDGHAKNFSIFLMAGDRYRLTPMYDVLSAWPIIGNGANMIPRQKVKMAMAWLGKNRHYFAETIYRRHFDTTALKCGVAHNAKDMIEEIIAATPRVVASVESELPAGFPQGLADGILKGLQRSAEQLT